MKPHSNLPLKVRRLPRGGDLFVEAPRPGKAYNQEVMGDEFYPEKEGDAQLIVIACNNFDKMRDRLNDLLDFIAVEIKERGDEGATKDDLEDMQAEATETQNLLNAIEGQILTLESEQSP